MNSRSVLLLYGLDQETLPVDAECTRETIPQAAQALRSRGWKVEASQVTDNLEAAMAPFPAEEWIVFNLCEGSPTQPFYYARVAELLEQRGYAYTGSGPKSLHQTQYKTVMKQLLEEEHLPTPRWRAAPSPELLSFDTFPALVKPAGEHCSFGITRESVVFDLHQARAQATLLARQFPGEIMLEEFIDGPEFGVSLWGEEPELEVLGISVITYEGLPDLRDRLCTFDAKWIPETEAYKKTMPVCPAPISPELAKKLAEISRQAYRCCDVRDYGRIDLRLQGDKPMILDVNSNCALSKNAGFPETARIAGWDYGATLERLAEMAGRRVSGPRRNACSNTAQTRSL
jgi:D-alanine-D-alanine ligase